MQGGNLIKMAL